MYGWLSRRCRRQSGNCSEARCPAGAAGAQSSLPGTNSLGAAGTASSRRHDFHLLGRRYGQVESGRKTIEVHVPAPTTAAVEVGDTVVFHDRDSGRELDIIVKRVTPYASLEDLLSAEDPARIDPDGPHEELLTSLRTNCPAGKEPLGLLAFEFDHRPARPGHPMPMTPFQYAQTVPHHTVYGCLYVRDEHDGPTGAESVFDPCGIPPSAPSLGVDVPQASTRPRRISHAPGTAANSPSAWAGSTNISLTSRSRDRCDLVTAWPRPRPGRGTGRGAVSCGRAVLPPPIR